MSLVCAVSTTTSLLSNQPNTATKFDLQGSPDTTGKTDPYLFYGDRMFQAIFLLIKVP